MLQNLGIHFKIPTSHVGLGDFVSCFRIYVVPVLFLHSPTTRKNLLPYTKALLGCIIAFSVAPGWYSTKCPVLFPLFIISLLAMGQIQTQKLPDLSSFLHSGCAGVPACHWGTIRRLLLGCRIQNVTRYKAKQLRTTCLHVSYMISIFSTNTCNHNIFWISSLQECLCILAFIPGQNKN